MSCNCMELALAVASGPLSIDDLLEWGLGRPSELWAALAEGQKSGVIEEDAAAGRGRFVLRDGARRAELLATATADDYALLAAQPALRPELLATARRLRLEHTFSAAGLIYRVLVTTVPPEAFPDGGERAWVGVLAELTRTFRQVYGVSTDLLERATGIAERVGDIASQALMIATRGMRAVVGGRGDEGRGLFQRARELAESLDSDPRGEIFVYVALGLTLEGRLRDAVAAFEDLLGDVPDQAIGVDYWREADSTTTVGPIGYLADAYANTGHYARAIELMHRVLRTVEGLGEPALIAEAQAFLALVYARQGNLAARHHAEDAWRFYTSHQDEPLYVWLSSLTMCWARAMEGRTDELEAIMQLGQAARRRGGNPPLAGAILYDLDAKLGPGVFAAVPSIDLVLEAERAVGWTSIFAAGHAHRFLARHLGRGASAGCDERIVAHLEQAVGLFTEAGASPDLAQALADLAAHCERTGDAPRARSLRDHERRVRSTLPQEVPSAERDRESHLARVVLGLGRLTTLRDRQEGFWGEIAERISQGLGADRVALVELTRAPKLLSVRGGDPVWMRQTLEFAATSGRDVCCADVQPGTRRVVVPFNAEGLDRRGLAVIEYEHAPAIISEADEVLLDALGTQLGVLFGNIVLWRELATARERLEQENRYFRESRPTQASGNIVAHSPAMTAVLGLVGRVAPSNTAVLVLGETGVGKELIAHEVHRQSKRAGGPFIAVHIASLAPGLVASGLFGHERGAFTGATDQQKGRFELADGGTIFLDEVGELSGEDQVRLLRVLQEGTFERVGGTRAIASDFRLVAATNRDLEAEVRAGRFREDLYFRLNVFPVRVPPLRERREEIPTLALLFMDRYARNLGRTFEGISEADMERLSTYAWPGNVRELEHLIERAVLLSDGPRLRIPAIESGGASVPAEGQEWITLEEAERRYVAKVLRHTSGRITGAGGAAELLDLKPSTLNWRIDKLGLSGLLAEVRGALRRRGVTASAPASGK